MFANAVLVVDAASADEFRTPVLAQRFVVFRTSVFEGRATQQRCYCREADSAARCDRNYFCMQQSVCASK